MGILNVDISATLNGAKLPTPVFMVNVNYPGGGPFLRLLLANDNIMSFTPEDMATITAAACEGMKPALEAFDWSTVGYTFGSVTITKIDDTETTVS